MAAGTPTRSTRQAWYGRPRLLYTAVFVWISFTGGRFTASFLEAESSTSTSTSLSTSSLLASSSSSSYYETNNTSSNTNELNLSLSSANDNDNDNDNDNNRLNSADIGTILAIPKVVGLFVGTFTGIWADTMEESYPHRGRLFVLGMGCFMGTIVFCFHGIHRILLPSSSTSTFFHSLPWFLFLRMLYAICTSLVFPILDGICIDFLKTNHNQEQEQRRHQQQLQNDDTHTIMNKNEYDVNVNVIDDNDNDNDNTNKNSVEEKEIDGASATDDYGKERLYGAISWAVSNMMIGPLLDLTNGNFWVLYPLSILSTIGVLISIVVYMKANNNNSNTNYNDGRNKSLGNDVLGRRLQKRDSNVILPDFEEDDIDVREKFIDNNVSNDNDNVSNRRGNGIETFKNTSIIKVSTKKLRLTINNDNDDNDNDDSPTALFTTTTTVTTQSNTNSNNISYYLSIFGVFAATKYTIAFMICLVSLSSGQAIVNDLIFLFFEILGSSYTLMSFTVVLTVIFEIPIFQMAPYLLKNCWGGCYGLLIVSSLSYCVRVMGYTLIPQHQPIWVLFLEPLHGITYACSQMAAIDFISTKLFFGTNNDNKTNNNSKKSNIIDSNDNDNDNDNEKYTNDNDTNSKNNTNDGTEATGQGFLQFFIGIGSVLGLELGGYAESTVGPRIMYRISALVVMMGSCSMLFILVYSNYNAVSSSVASGASSWAVSLQQRIFTMMSYSRQHTNHHNHHVIPQTDEIVELQSNKDNTKNANTGSTAVIEMIVSK